MTGVARGPALVLLAAAALAFPPAASAQPDERRKVERLSNERTTTVAARVRLPTWIRSSPRFGSDNKVGLLQPFTFFGSREVVVVRARKLDRRGRSWSLVRYSGLGWRRGWVFSGKLFRLRTLHTQLVIDRARFQARLYRRGRLILRVPVGVGASASPTPAGRFYIRERLVPPEPNGVYGVLAFGTSAFSRFRTDWPGGGQVGVHGTNQPWLIPGRISNGCVRLHNSHVRRLDRLMPVGTPLRIL